MEFVEQGEPEGVRRGVSVGRMIKKYSPVSQCHPVDENIMPHLTVQSLFMM